MKIINHRPMKYCKGCTYPEIAVNIKFDENGYFHIIFMLGKIFLTKIEKRKIFEKHQILKIINQIMIV